ncbi:MAG TPA: OmpA family protein [Polyangiaceae bacterium]|nr:OmpA family protein [Polyangiaceae bacterium]
MHTFRTGSQLVLSKLVLHSTLVSITVLAAACGGVSTFQGQSAISVVGTPPAPPPPPPPPPKKEEPPPPPARVEVRDNKIEINEKIQFEYNKATILQASFSLMDEIADTIKKNAHIKKIAIEGHASSEGDAAHNLKLSDDRAKAVMKYIVDKGVDAGRLTAKGFGAKRPIADNNTPEGKEKNRRVEFVILEQDVTQKKVEVDHTGKEKVLEEKKLTDKKEEPAADAKAAPPAAAQPGAAAPKKLPALKAPPKPADKPAEKK